MFDDVSPLTMVLEFLVAFVVQKADVECAQTPTDESHSNCTETIINNAEESIHNTASDAATDYW
jgi:hypothetical protein